MHVDKLLNKANSRLLKKAGLNPSDIVHIYCSLIRSQIEYASPVWSGLPNTLSDLIEAVQKRALKIAHLSLSYEEALEQCGVDLLSKRRDMACQKLLKSLRNDEPSYNPLTNIVRSVIPQRFHNYNLRSDNSELSPIISECYKNFFTIKYG